MNQWKATLAYPCRRAKEVKENKLVHLPSQGSGSSLSGKKAKGAGSSDSPTPRKTRNYPAARVQFASGAPSRSSAYPKAIPEDDVVDISDSTELDEMGGDRDRKDLDPFTISTIEELDSFDRPPQRKYSSRVPRFTNPPSRRQQVLSTTMHDSSMNEGTTFDQHETRISFAPAASTIHSVPSYMQ